MLRKLKTAEQIGDRFHFAASAAKRRVPWSEYLKTDICVIIGGILGLIMLYLLWREIDTLF